MKIAIIGAGGHAKEIYQSIFIQNQIDILDGFFVERDFFSKDSLYNKPIKSLNELDIKKHLIHIAIGDLNSRFRLFNFFKKSGFNFINIIDPRSTISNSLLGESVYIAPGSYINADVKIGDCVIINTGSIISHECVIGDFCNISPGSVLCGNVKIGKKCFIGARSVIKENVNIGDDITLGMGSILIRNILESGTYITNVLKNYNVCKLAK